MATNKKTADVAKETTETVFQKEELLKAKVFANRKDALGAIIKDGESLTVDEAKTRLENFLKGEVK